MSRVLLVVVPLVLAIYALIDCLQVDKSRVRGLSKPLWLLVIVFVPVLGPLAWLLFGGPRKRRRTPRAKPVPPDDNPDFLNKIQTIDEEHDALLDEWEREQRRKQRRSGASPAATPTTGGAEPTAGTTPEPHPAADPPEGDVPPTDDDTPTP